MVAQSLNWTLGVSWFLSIPFYLTKLGYRKSARQLIDGETNQDGM